MAVPHWVHLYQKPKQGTAFIRRFPVLNYRHKIRARGWFDTASCDLIVSAHEGERFLEQYLGNRVAVYVDNPAEPIWEGYISRITFEYGSVVYTISLDEMANRVYVTYNDPDNVPPQRMTGGGNNTDSQAVYGIKGMFFDGNVYYGGSGAGRWPRVLQDTELSLRAWPIPTSAFRGQGGAPIVHVEMRGFYSTLDWTIYDQAISLEVAIDTLVQAIVASDWNGQTFYNNAATFDIDGPTGVFYDQANQSGLGLWQFLTQIAEAGDDSAVNTRRHVMGITPTDPRTGERRFYYRRANPTLVYCTRLRRQVGQILNAWNRPVSPWQVLPDRGIQIVDSLPGWALQGDDPRAVYLESVDYDAERGTVSFQSSDDISIEGVFRMKRMTRAVNKSFGRIRGSY